MPGRLKSVAAVALATAAFVALAACGGDSETAVEGPVTFVGADGVTSTIDDASRVVSLSGDITEFIFELGHGSSVVGIDVTTVFPAEAAELPIVGWVDS